MFGKHPRHTDYRRHDVVLYALSPTVMSKVRMAEPGKHPPDRYLVSLVRRHGARLAPAISCGAVAKTKFAASEAEGASNDGPRAVWRPERRYFFA